VTRRTRLHRFLAAFSALWLAISIAEPAVLHLCPMHDGVAAAAGTQGDHTGHGAHAAADAAADANAPSDEESSCLCIGDCPAAAGVSLLPAGVAITDVVLTIGTDSGLPDFEYLPVSRALLLPFANGPPSLPPSIRVS
jgi:hypothetical protein